MWNHNPHLHIQSLGRLDDQPWIPTHQRLHVQQVLVLIDLYRIVKVPESIK